MKPSLDFRLCLAAILPMVLTLPLVATSGVPRPLASLSLATSFLLWALSGMPDDTQSHVGGQTILSCGFLRYSDIDFKENREISGKFSL